MTHNNPYKLGTCQSTTIPINLVHVKVQQPLYTWYMSKYNNPYKLGTCQSTTIPINLVHVKVQQPL